VPTYSALNPKQQGFGNGLLMEPPMWGGKATFLISFRHLPLQTGVA